MPELPEVEILKRDMQRILLHRTFEDVVVRRHDLRCPVPRELASLVKGKRCNKIQRRGKYLILHLAPDGFLVIHLGMSGQILCHDVGRHTHEHIICTMQGGLQWSYRDVRRFGFFTYASSQYDRLIQRINVLGLEPLTKEFTAKRLQKRLARRQLDIKDCLLDQNLVAGLGNIYASEVLFRSGISPFARGCDLSLKQLTALISAINDVLAEAIEKGGSSIKDCVHLDGRAGDFQKYHRVYGRQGEGCATYKTSHCGEVKCEGIKKVIQKGRSTFYCPHRQHK